MLGSLFKTERRAVQSTAWGSWDGTEPTWAGVNVDTKSSLQLLTVYGCNRFICDGISTLPTDTFRQNGDVKTEIPKPGWLEEPAPGLDPVAWHGQTLTSLLLAGDSFWFKDYADGSLSSAVPLDPTKVGVSRTRGRKVFQVEGEQFDSNRIEHIPALMFPGSDRGLSPVEAAKQTVGAGMAVTEFSSRFWSQGGTFGGVIEDPGSLDAAKAKETARIWARLHSGKSKAHLPGVLQGGATWKPTAVSPEQAQFLETRGFTSAEIASFLFLIDASEFSLFMGQGGSITYANLEQRNARKVQVTFLPWMVRIERTISRLLPKPRYYKFNVEGLLRGDMKTRYESYKLGIEAKFLVPNEARELEDMPPLDGGDVVTDINPQTKARSVERDEHGRILRVVG